MVRLINNTISQILDASQKKYYGKLCGLVLAGRWVLLTRWKKLLTFLFLFYFSTGAGKTTVVRQLQEKSSSRKQSLLRSKMIASYIVPNKRLSSGSHLVQFLHNIYCQLVESPALTRFKQQNDNSWLREAVDDPDEVFKKIILFPLLECEVQHKVVIFMVDGLDLDLIQPGAAATGRYFHAGLDKYY